MYVYCIAAALAAASECPTASCDPASLVIPMPSEITLAQGSAPVDGPVATVIDEKWTDLGEEGYSLYCHQEGYRLTAHTKKGLFYGQQTINQLKRLGLVPCCTMEDKPVMGMRAVMLDLARLKEKHDYYYHIIDQLAQWKINTVFLHLTDHSGCAIEFKKHPTLATKYAFTADEMRKLIKYAADRRIELIPEVEPWGHAKYITTRPEYADLAEDKSDPRALCTSNPKTWELLRDLFEEMAALFPSKYIHAGCDEAAFGKCKECTEKIRRDGADALVGEHLKKTYELVKATGKIPMMWGDVLLSHRGSADILPKDAIITHWDYKANLSAEPTEFLRKKGFEVVGCPAIVWGSRMMLPMADTFDNVTNFAKIVLDQKCLGMDTTVWVPQRYITDTLNMAFAHAAELSWSGQRRTRIDFAAVFAKNYYGLDPTLPMARALLDVHELSMKSLDRLQDVWGYAKEAGKKTEQELSSASTADRDKAKAIADALRGFRPSVKDHVEEYDSVLLAADIRSHIESRAICINNVIRALRTAREVQGSTSKESVYRLVGDSLALLERSRDQDRVLTHRLEQAWDRWRYADDPKKTDGGENLLGGFYISRDFFDTVIPRLREAREQSERGKKVDWPALLDKPKQTAGSAEIDAGDVPA